MQIILGKPGIFASFPVSPNIVLNKTMRLYFTGGMSFAYSSKNKDEKERWKHPSLVIHTDLHRHKEATITILATLPETSARKAQQLSAFISTCILTSFSFKRHSEFSGW